MALVASGCSQGSEVKLDPAEERVPVVAPTASATATATATPSAKKPPPAEGRVAQCNRLIEVINEEQEPIKQMKSAGHDAKAFKKLGDVLDGVAKRVGEVPISDTKLKGLQAEYVTMARGLADASREAAVALGGTDMKVTTEAIKKMQTFSPRESEIVDDMNKYCSGVP